MEDLSNSHCSTHSSPKNFNLDWMKYIPDNIKLSELTIPGTHDSCAYQMTGLLKVASAVARTQSWCLYDQMRAGIRYFDIRLRLYNNTLLCFHGPVDLNNSFDKILKDASKFLRENCSEVLIMEICSEYEDYNCSKSMEQMYYEYTALYRDIVVEFENNNPTIGEVRGKMLMIKVFKGSSSRIPIFCIQNKWVCNFISNIGEKIKEIEKHCRKAAEQRNDDKIYMNFLSCASDYAMMQPITAAKECNKVIFRHRGRLGIVAADFPGEGLIKYLILQNFGGVEKVKRNIEKNLTIINKTYDDSYKEMAEDIKTTVINTSIGYNNFELPKSTVETDDINYGDTIYIKNNETQTYLYLADAYNICCYSEKMPLTIMKLNDTNVGFPVLSGDYISLSFGEITHNFYLERVNAESFKVRNNSIVILKKLFAGNTEYYLKTNPSNFENNYYKIDYSFPGEPVTSQFHFTIEK